MTSSKGRRQFHDYQDLMRYRIMDILLVSTPYDTFILEESGELSERMLGEFRNLDLHYAPALTGVTSGAEALRLAREQRRINLIITTPHLPDMDAAELARQLRAEGLDIPVVLLAWDTRELREFEARVDISQIERTFLWQGDARILVAIVKSVEDRRNVEHDASAVAPLSGRALRGVPDAQTDVLVSLQRGRSPRGSKLRQPDDPGSHQGAWWR